MPMTGQETELSALGLADWSVTLDPGCHRFDVMGEARGGGSRHDVDAELREPDDGRILARDRTDSADARLEYCAGAEVRAAVSVSGSPGAKVNIMHTAWPLPSHLPEQWGAPLRARMATRLTAGAAALTRSDIGSVKVSFGVKVPNRFL